MLLAGSRAGRSPRPFPGDRPRPAVRGFDALWISRGQSPATDRRVTVRGALTSAFWQRVHIFFLQRLVTSKSEERVNPLVVIKEKAFGGSLLINFAVIVSILSQGHVSILSLFSLFYFSTFACKFDTSFKRKQYFSMRLDFFLLAYAYKPIIFDSKLFR